MSRLRELCCGVNNWLGRDDGVEASRPSHCPHCGASAHGKQGLQIYGHGVRIRTVWGPRNAAGEAETWEVTVRRYVCRTCERAWTVQRRGLSPRLRYTLPAIALALASWTLWQQRVSAVRQRISPWRKRGYGDPDRWRSLERWSRRCAPLFGLFGLSTRRAKTAHELAVRAAHLVSARGPTCCSMSERVFIGAYSR
jgi:hypothetical protein